ncbi:MAG: hypothetical protein HYZ72_12350 [Deltaproteobacteria bacterium]|nr:hypothetical protein [Deltaproteobacteria bacterium]
MRCREALCFFFNSWLGGIFLVILLLAGCARSLPLLAPPSPLFPPQMVMENGNYAGFLAENLSILEKCGERTGCEIALFNLGFVHAYPQSPYRDPAKALQYFGDLRKKYPQSPWAYQGQVWVALINEIRTREATIRSLRVQLHRSRDIDIEIERKERELGR